MSDTNFCAASANKRFLRIEDEHQQGSLFSENDNVQSDIVGLKSYPLQVVIRNFIRYLQNITINSAIDTASDRNTHQRLIIV